MNGSSRDPARSGQVSDAVLTGQLAGLIERLREAGYGRIAPGVDLAIQGAAEDFLDLLSRHLLYEEEVLFPALREGAPHESDAFTNLSREHAALRRVAAHIAALVRLGKLEEARDQGRLFLATLLPHIAREAEVIRRSTSTMSGKVAGRVQTLLENEDHFPL